MSSENKRSVKKEEMPQRVQQAAQSMNSGFSDGMRLGYVPQNTGRTSAYPPGFGQTGGFQTYPQQPANDRAGANYASSMTGSQRGYAPSANHRKATGEKARQKSRKPVIIAVSAFALACAAALILYFTDAFGIVSGNRSKTTGTAVAERQLGGTDGTNTQTDSSVQAISRYDETFCPGIYVNGIPLEGMTGNEAFRAVQEQIQRQNDWYVRLVYDGQEAFITAEMLGMKISDESIWNTLEEAWKPVHNFDGTKSNEQRAAEIQQLQTEQQNYRVSGPTAEDVWNRLGIMLNDIKMTIDRQPQDAVMLYFDPTLDYPFVFQDEVYGLSLDVTSLQGQIWQMISTLEIGTVEVQPAVVQTTVTREDLKKHYAKRSEATTPIDKHSTDNRNNNIRRAFESINGYELKAGRQFNFNQVVGKRTIANGFYTAEEYVYGEHQEGVGGGVCQASTTVYQAAVCAGLKINKRKPHSDSVSYTDYGKDATVYWYETDSKPRTDLIFTNNTDSTIYIVAVVESDPNNKKRLRCRVTMYGEDLGENVRYELYAEVVDVLPAPVEPEYVDSEDKVRKKKDGYKVKSYRLKYEGNVLVERKELATDTYKPQAERVYSGN